MVGQQNPSPPFSLARLSYRFVVQGVVPGLVLFYGGGHGEGVRADCTSGPAAGMVPGLRGFRGFRGGAPVSRGS